MVKKAAMPLELQVTATLKAGWVVSARLKPEMSKAPKKSVRKSTRLESNPQDGNAGRGLCEKTVPR